MDMSFNFLPKSVEPVANFIVLGILVGTALVHCAFAFGVFQYGAGTGRFQLSGSPRFQVRLAPLAVWTLATLLGGVFVAVAFWVVHCSTLASEPKNTP